MNSIFTPLISSFALNVQNPFDVIGGIFREYATPISQAFYAGAVLCIVAAVLVGMFGGQQARQKMKSHLIYIIGGVIIVAAVGYWISLGKDTATKFSTIIPLFSQFKQLPPLF